jgi:hypothetical protein
MEWFFVLLGVVIFFGPIVWALTVGRKGGAPEKDDAQGATAYGSFITRILTWGRRG